ncbi:MAG: vitamin K epoxide reductase family protein [Myxococcota bacterium]
MRRAYIPEQHPDENAVAVLQNLVVAIEAEVSPASARRALLEHHAYPSLMSLQDTLAGWGVKSSGFQLSIKHLRKMALPAVAHLNDGRFVLVEAVEATEVAILDPAAGRQRQSLEAFASAWSGALLTVDRSTRGRDPGFAAEQRAARRRAWTLGLALAAGIVGALSFASPVLVLELLGLGLSLRLAAMEWTEGAEPKLCRMSKRLSCTAVLRSARASLFGVKLSELGVLYFAVGAALATAGPSLWLSLLLLSGLPIVGYGLLTQALVLRRFCALCLLVHAAVIAAVIFGISAPEAFELPRPPLGLALLSLSLTLGLLPLLRRAAASPRTELELARLRAHPALLEAMMAAEAPRILEGAPVQIALGSETAARRLQVVLSPSCGACRAIYPEVEALVSRRPELGVDLFLASPGPKATPELKRLGAALLRPQAEAERRQTLDAWFKDHAVPEVPEPQSSPEAERWWSWSRALALEAVPAILIDGRPLPGFATLEAVASMLSE